MRERIQNADNYFQGILESCPIHPPEHPILGDSGEKLTAEETITKRELFVKRMVVDSYYIWRKMPKQTNATLYEVREDENSLYIVHANEKILFAEKKDDIVTDLDMSVVDECEVTVGDPVAPWGAKGSVLMTHIGRDPVFAPYDLPPDLKTQVIEVDSRIQQVYLRYAEQILQQPSISTGINFGATGIDNLGLQTMIHYHKQIFIPNPDSASYTLNDILRLRAAQSWDGGVSQHFANAMLEDLHRGLLPYNNRLQIIPDAMGFSVVMPDFTPDQYNVDFVDSCMRPLALIIHEYLRDVYKVVWGRKSGKDMKDIIWHLYQAQFQGLDREYYEDFFPALSSSDDLSFNEPVRDSIREIQPDLIAIACMSNENGKSLLRKPPGWAFLLNYQGGNALMTATFGFLNKNMGPVEGGGISLLRPKEVLTPQKRYEMTAFNKKILKEACEPFL